MKYTKRFMSISELVAYGWSRYMLRMLKGRSSRMDTAKKERYYLIQRNWIYS